MNDACTWTKNIQKYTNKKVFSSSHYPHFYSLCFVSILTFSSKLRIFCDLTVSQLAMTNLSLNGFRKAEVVSSLTSLCRLATWKMSHKPSNIIERINHTLRFFREHASIDKSDKSIP